ncbi:hypothetical protein V6N12_048090 [Hibiscus sabdariffa]|uniref:Uncharacterized protein n=1 Tax=Hibiscus sabdariffa TaxID=183260 RepID=A0ABR2CVC6_9ROSI
MRGQNRQTLHNKATWRWRGRAHALFIKTMAKLAGAHFYPACMTGAKLACCMHASLTGKLQEKATSRWPGGPHSRVSLPCMNLDNASMTGHVIAGIHGGAVGIYSWAPRFNYIYTLVNNVSSIIDGFPFCSNIVALLCLMEGAEGRTGPPRGGEVDPTCKVGKPSQLPQRPEQLKPVSAHTRPPRGGEVPRSLLKMA